MLSSETRDTILSLVRLGIGRLVSYLPDTIDWQAIEDLAHKHGLLAVMIDGIEHLSEQLRPPKALLLECCSIIQFCGSCFWIS